LVLFAGDIEVIEEGAIVYDSLTGVISDIFRGSYGTAYDIK